MRTRVRPKIPSLILLLIWLGPSFGPALGLAAQEPESFRFRLSFEPRTLDWTYGDTPILVTLNTMRGLFRVNDEGKVVPDLVKSFSKSSDEKVWTFQLHPELKWSDGIPFSAKQVVDGIERLKDPKTASSYSHFVSQIETIQRISDHEIKIQITKKLPYLPAILSHWVTYPVRLDLITKFKDYGVSPSHMAFLGAYQVDSWSKNEFRLSPNPFSEKKPALKKVRALVVTEDETASNLYQTGMLDFVTDPGFSSLNHPDLKTHQSPILYFIAVTANHPLTRNKKALQALSLALTRSEIPKLLAIPHRPTHELCPPEYCPSRFFVTDLDPKVLLQNSGLGDISKIPPLTLHYFKKPAMHDLAQWIQSQWKTKLGIQVVLDSTDVKSYWAKMERSPPPVFLNSKGASYPDASTYFELFRTDNPQNFGKWSDTEYDRIIEAAAQESSEKKQTELYAQASMRVVWENPGLIPLYFRNTPYLLKPQLKGFKINPSTGIDFTPIHYSQSPKAQDQ